MRFILTCIFAFAFLLQEGIPTFDKGIDTTGKPWAGQYAANEETVRGNLRRLGVFAANVRIVKGFFQDTLPHKLTAPQLAVLRFDGDTYESTKAVFSTIYDKVVRGGYVIIDDWHVPRCRDALREMFGSLEVYEIQGLGRHKRKWKNNTTREKNE